MNKLLPLIFGIFYITIYSILSSFITNLHTIQFILICLLTLHLFYILIDIKILQPRKENKKFSTIKQFNNKVKYTIEILLEEKYPNKKYEIVDQNEHTWLIKDNTYNPSIVILEMSKLDENILKQNNNVGFNNLSEDTLLSEVITQIDMGIEKYDSVKNNIEGEK